VFTGHNVIGKITITFSQNLFVKHLLHYQNINCYNITNKMKTQYGY